MARAQERVSIKYLTKRVVARVTFGSFFIRLLLRHSFPYSFHSVLVSVYLQGDHLGCLTASGANQKERESCLYRAGRWLELLWGQSRKRGPVCALGAQDAYYQLSCRATSPPRLCVEDHRGAFGDSRMCCRGPAGSGIHSKIHSTFLKASRLYGCELSRENVLRVVLGPTDHFKTFRRLQICYLAK